MTKSIRPLFINDFTREFFRGFMDPDKLLETRLDEICSRCPLGTAVKKNGIPDFDLQVVDNCRMEFFGQLLQSFVGRPGDDETRKLFTCLKKCEDCLASKVNNTRALQETGTATGN